MRRAAAGGWTRPSARCSSGCSLPSRTPGAFWTWAVAPGISVRLRQQMWYLVRMLVILVLGHLYVALWVLTQPVRSALPVWMITAAGLVAVATMVVSLLVIYPELRGELVERDAGSRRS